MSGKLLLGDGEAAHTACARILARGGTDERTGEVLSAGVVAERVAWCAALVRGMAAGLLAEHWTAGDVRALASGRDPTGRPLPSQAWMALRRLGWAAPVPEGITVNDRVVRMAQEQAGRLLRSAGWRAALTGAVLAAWPARPDKRTPEEWDAVRAALPGRRARSVCCDQGPNTASPAVPSHAGPTAAGRVRTGGPACAAGDARRWRRATGSRLLSSGTRPIPGGRCCGSSFLSGPTLATIGTGPGWRCR